MKKIILIEGGEVKIGSDDGSVTTVPLGCLRYSGAMVGDCVELYNDNGTFIVLRAKAPKATSDEEELPAGYKKSEKSIYTWVHTWLFGAFGVNRFVRGQIGLGVLKLVLNISVFIPMLVGVVGALTTSSGSFYGYNEQAIIAKIATGTTISIILSIVTFAWNLTDTVIALVKSYGASFGDKRFLVFDEAGNFTK